VDLVSGFGCFFKDLLAPLILPQIEQIFDGVLDALREQVDWGKGLKQITQ
jgi:hypothetical protein